MIERFLARHLRRGRINLHLPDGAIRPIGAGEPSVDWHIHDRNVLFRIAKDPELELGETFVEGGWSVPDGNLLGLLEILLTNVNWEQTKGRLRVVRRITRFARELNRVRTSYRNVAHHYNLDQALFRLFLDEDLHYSCAYFANPEATLEKAQRAKCEHIMRKLCLRPGHRVLDIGCGWGALAQYLVEHADIEVTGITLSREQLEVARERAERSAQRARLHFELADYREHIGRYDRVVSVGMFEHVGRPNYRQFFERVRDMLCEDGVALVHTIGSSGPPSSTTNEWIRRHIFPGGALPALSELSSAVERAGLVSSDVEVLRLHYAQTLAIWRTRFLRNRTLVADRMGERFCRIWEFYLTACEASFRWWDLVVFHLQFARHNAAVPITRDYLYAEPVAPASSMPARTAIR